MKCRLLHFLFGSAAVPAISVLILAIGGSWTFDLVFRFALVILCVLYSLLMDVSPIKKRGMESPTDSEQLALNNLMITAGSQPDDRFVPAVVSVSRRSTSFVEEEDTRMGPLDLGNTPNPARQENSFIREQIALMLQRRQVGREDIVSLSERQQSTEKTANALVNGLRSVISSLEMQQDRMVSDEVLMQQRINTHQQEIQHSVQASLDRGRFLRNATQNALSETQVKVQHLADS